MNRFLIEDSFAIQPDTFVFAGRIIEGYAEVGMTFLVPEAGHKWRVAIKAIEFLDKRGGESLIGLCVQNDNYLPGLGEGWTAELREAVDKSGS